MVTIEEILTWETADIFSWVQLELGRRGMVLTSEEIYHLRVTKDDVTVWEESNLSERNLLLSLCWWIVGYNKTSNPTWETRRTPVYTTPVRQQRTKVIPDPEDLDPSSILELVNNQRRNS